jgi:hypothetical protein
VPDIAFTPIPGTIYTGKTTKVAEHGGFSAEERHVALLVSGAGVPVTEVSDSVSTTQVAPTVLAILGLDHTRLEAVSIEKTAVLPGFE